MEMIGFGFTFLLLIAGIVLSIITILRMIRGDISLPRWAKFLLIAGMIAMHIILLLALLPPLQVQDLFENVYIDPATPINPVGTETTAP